MLCKTKAAGAAPPHMHIQGIYIFLQRGKEKRGAMKQLVITAWKCRSWKLWKTMLCSLSLYGFSYLSYCMIYVMILSNTFHCSRFRGERNTQSHPLSYNSTLPYYFKTRLIPGYTTDCDVQVAQLVFNPGSLRRQF